jgi:hypothetical protein
VIVNRALSTLPDVGFAIVNEPFLKNKYRIKLDLDSSSMIWAMCEQYKKLALLQIKVLGVQKII